MELNNIKIVQVLPLEIGTSKAGKEWKKRSFIVETDNAEYPKKICLSAWGDVADLPYREDVYADIQFDIESREYNGRWYTDIKAYRVLLHELPSVPQKNKPAENKEAVANDFPPSLPPEMEEPDFPEQPEDTGLPF